MATLGIPNLSAELEVSLSAGMAEVEDLLSSHIEGNYPFATTSNADNFTFW